jgi:hypothetical protein
LILISGHLTPEAVILSGFSLGNRPDNHANSEMGHRIRDQFVRSSIQLDNSAHRSPLAFAKKSSTMYQ